MGPGVKHGRGVTLTTHPHLVQRSLMCRSYNSCPPSASMACSGTALLTISDTENADAVYAHTLYSVQQVGIHPKKFFLRNFQNLSLYVFL
jgi:hypothetical protein